MPDRPAFAIKRAISNEAEDVPGLWRWTAAEVHCGRRPLWSTGVGSRPCFGLRAAISQAEHKFGCGPSTIILTGQTADRGPLIPFAWG